MNTQLVKSIAQLILALSPEERSLLEHKLFFDGSEPPARALMQLAEVGGVFEFLDSEPDLYTLADGEPVT